MGPPDVLLVGEKVGAISGWILLDDDLQGFTLIRTGAIRQFTSQHASPELRCATAIATTITMMTIARRRASATCRSAA